MLVVKVVSESQIQVIHKIFEVVEEVISYKPNDITVLDYYVPTLDRQLLTGHECVLVTATICCCGATVNTL